MKRFFVALAAFGLTAAVVTAQDFKKAVDTFNAGATALETNKGEALTQFRAALEEANLCEGEEAAELVTKCKETISSTLLSIAKEQINEANYDDALATLAETKAIATEYGVSAVVEEATGLVSNVYLRKGSSLLKAKDFAGAAAALKELVAIEPENG